ncbi:MAG: TetR/AcrR family transcriptional regulator [Micropepsaceae bacterium]
MSDAVLDLPRPQAQPQARTSRKRSAVIEAARRVFTDKGYNASMEEVAFEAEVSKQTIYNQFGSKEQLFHAMIEDRIQEMIEPIVSAGPDVQPREVLIQIARSYHTKIVAPDNIKMMRALIAAPNAQAALAQIYAHGPSRFVRTFADWLSAQNAAGRLKVDDPVLAAEHFASFTYGHLFMKRLYGVPAPFDAEDVERRVAYVVDAFLRAHAA